MLLPDFNILKRIPAIILPVILVTGCATKSENSILNSLLYTKQLDSTTIDSIKPQNSHDTQWMSFNYGDPQLPTKIEPDKKEEIEYIKAITAINALNENNPASAGTPKKSEIKTTHEKPHNLKPLRTHGAIDLSWSLNTRIDSSGEKRCTLSAGTFEIYRHNYATQIWLTISETSMYIFTTTNLDISLPESGIRTENGKLLPFDGQFSHNIAFWKLNLNELLVNNNYLSIELRGDELGNNKHEAVISLQGIKAAKAGFDSCLASQKPRYVGAY